MKVEFVELNSPIFNKLFDIKDENDLADFVKANSEDKKEKKKNKDDKKKKSSNKKGRVVFTRIVK